MILSFVSIGTGVGAFFRPLANMVAGEMQMIAADKMTAAKMDVFFMIGLTLIPRFSKRRLRYNEKFLESAACLLRRKV